MPACTFFGHRDCPVAIKPTLQKVLVQLIEHHHVDRFYVGNQGNFDGMVHSVLKELVQVYPQIQYAVVLAYLPQNPEKFNAVYTILPEGIESVSKRFAIPWRNQWMIAQSDFVVTFITHAGGGAARFAKLAEKQKKTMFHLRLP